jgi:superfamily II DNA or RNA helicase
MIHRYAFQRNRPESAAQVSGGNFLSDKLKNAVAYDRIAGYFDSSLLEIAGEALEGVKGKIRIICNSDISSDDVEIADRAQKLSFFKHSPEEMVKRGRDRFERLYRLLTGEGGTKLEVRVLPNQVFGLIHGKAGVICYAGGARTSFLGSANETLSGWSLNYELVWEDDSQEACDWVQAEFDRLWSHPSAVPLSQAVVQEVKRLSLRQELDLESWRKDLDPAAVAVESPVFRREFGLWPHQKYFVQEAWKSHQAHGARYVLADQVGLGKTVQLGMAAQLMAMSSDKPILILLPKTLMLQWQTELWDLLDVPSARWDGSQWIDEAGIVYPSSTRKPLLECPRKIGLVSQGLVIHGSELSQSLLDLEWECVIVDEAHRARRRKLPKSDERGPYINNPETETNNLFAFLWKIAAKTKSMLLATATPVQMHPIEVWDMLRLLSEGNDHVLGNFSSEWRKPDSALPYILGERTPPDDTATLWPWLKNPLPPSWEDPRFKNLRSRFDMDDRLAVLPKTYYELQGSLRVIADGAALNLFSTHHPFLRSIVRRTREYLENTIDPATKEPYLKHIELELYGEKDPIPLSGYLMDAYAAAEEFCRMLNRRVRSAGFFKTLLLRRIGSSMRAGLSTVTKMLDEWGGAEGLESEEDEFEENSEAALGASSGLPSSFNDHRSELKDLTRDERRKLEQCKGYLETSREEDPKWNVILHYLADEAWADDGCILFSQYYDTAWWVAEGLFKAFPDRRVAVYAGSGKSGIFTDGKFLRRERDDIKKMVRDGEITLLVGTDAASEGLNLQRLGTLINIDLPWNPTRLEQRKGRIQRIGQRRDTVRVLNLRYKGSVEDKVHNALSGRLDQIRKMFGQIPDVLEDVWIDIALDEKTDAEQRIDALPPLHAFDERYSKVGDVAGWEDCAKVLNAEDRGIQLRKGWVE